MSPADMNERCARVASVAEEWAACRVCVLNSAHALREAKARVRLGERSLEDAEVAEVRAFAALERERLTTIDGEVAP